MVGKPLSQTPPTPPTIKVIKFWGVWDAIRTIDLEERDVVEVINVGVRLGTSG
jgi:hypothetical protein